jgi:hypothetical protein
LLRRWRSFIVEEKLNLEEIYPKVKPFTREGAIEAQGTWTNGTDGDLETPLIDNKDCAYVIFDGKTALCGIEQAYNQGIIDWKNLFLVIFIHSCKDYTEFAAVKYDKWDICDRPFLARSLRFQYINLSKKP